MEIANNYTPITKRLREICGVEDSEPMEIENNPYTHLLKTIISYGLGGGSYEEWAKRKIREWEDEQTITTNMFSFSIPTLIRHPQEAMDRMINISKQQDMPPINLYGSEGYGYSTNMTKYTRLSDADFPAKSYEVEVINNKVIATLFYWDDTCRLRDVSSEAVYYDWDRKEYSLQDWDKRNAFAQNRSLKTPDMGPGDYWWLRTADLFVDNDSTQFDRGPVEVDMEESEQGCDVETKLLKKPAFHKLYQHRFHKTGKRPF